MSNVFDYLDWRGDLSMSVSPFCEVDNLVLSMLAYLDYSGIVSDYPSRDEITLKELCDKYFAENRDVKRGVIIPEKLNDLLKKCSESTRFSDVRVSNYVNIIESETAMQFSATLFRFADRSMFIAIRGTDDTLTGWRENFSLSFEFAVPSQIAATQYLDRIGKMFFGKIRLGGHSKGGNLSVFAAAQCKKRILHRITAVYNNDGPGFSGEFFNSNEFKTITGRVFTFIPESSVIGMMLEHDEDYTIVKSSGHGILQHNALLWEVQGDKFVTVDKLSSYAEKTDKIVRNWLRSMSKEERKSFTEALFSVLESANAQTLTDIQESSVKKMLVMANAFRNTDKEAKDMLVRLIKQIFS